MKLERGPLKSPATLPPGTQPSTQTIFTIQPLKNRNRAKSSSRTCGISNKWRRTADPVQRTSGSSTFLRSGLRCTCARCPLCRMKGFESWWNKWHPDMEPSLAKQSPKKLRKMSTKVNKTILDTLCDTPSVRAATDCWTDDTGSSYSSFTFHYIDPNCNMKKILVACQLIHGRQNVESLASFISHTARRVNLLQKNTFILVDNASNAWASIRIAAAQSAVMYDNSYDVHP